MSRKFEPREVEEPKSRPLPRRRPPALCVNGRLHNWILDPAKITRRLPDFWNRHQDAPPNWEWVVCRTCQFAYMRRRTCLHCGGTLLPSRGTKPRRVCEGCLRTKRIARNSKWATHNPELVRSYRRAYRQRKRLERIAREIMSEGEAA